MAKNILLILELILVGMLIWFSCVVLPPMRCENAFLKFKNKALQNAVNQLLKERKYRIGI